MCLAQLGGDPGSAVGAPRLGVDDADLLRQLGILAFPLLAGRTGYEPLVEAGAGDLQYFAQPLDAEGAAVVLNELEAAYQVISEAKNFVAFRKISRSVASF